MNRRQKELCLEITKKLKERPAAALFREPVDATKPGCETYYDIIEDPQDFSSIEKRLTEGEYRSVREWKRDITLIFKNAI